MTLPEIDLICSYDPEAGKRQTNENTGILGEMAQWQKARDYANLPPRGKLEKRLRERDGR